MEKNATVSAQMNMCCCCMCHNMLFWHVHDLRVQKKRV